MDYLINNLLAMGVILLQDMSPEFWALSLNEISSLHSVKVVAVSDLNKFHIARSPRTLVSDECKVRVTLLAELTNYLAIIEGVVNEESLRILVYINVDHG